MICVTAFEIDYSEYSIHNRIAQAIDMNFRATSSEKRTTRSQLLTRFRGVFFSLAAFILLLGAHSAVHAADPVNGETLFKANCQSCHSPALEKKSTGPALMGVTGRIPEGDWRYNWVRNSAKVIESGDAYANKVWSENAKSPMTAFPAFTNEQIDDIFAWIDSYVPPVDVVDPKTGINFSDDETLSSLWNWIRLLIFAIVILLANIALQIARLRGVEFLAGVNLDKLNARMMLGFFVFGAAGAIWSSMAYAPYYLANNSASAHGAEIDQLFWITMVVVFGVFILVNGILFWFVYKYGKDGDRKAKYYPENHKLELIWTVVPAITLAVLIIFGIKTWTSIMSKPEGANMVKVEVSGQQWGWTLRYPGADAEFGDVDVRRIGGDNILGVDMEDKRTADDFMHDSLVVPKGAIVDMKIRSRDVLHSVYLPHFRVKMDAVPGMDTRFHFVPTQTTAEFRENLKKENAYWGQLDTIVSKSYNVGDTMPNGIVATAQTVVTDSIFKADSFDFELACAEVCGRGHFSMRRVVVVMEPADYEAWRARTSKSTIAASMGIKPAMQAEPMADRNKPGDAPAKSILE